MPGGGDGSQDDDDDENDEDDVDNDGTKKIRFYVMAVLLSHSSYH